MRIGILSQRNSTLCESKSKSNFKFKKIFSNMEPEKCITLIKSKFNIIDDDVKREMIQETAGNLSSNLIVGVFALAGGGIAVFAHPVAGCIIMVISIFYGSCIKVYAGRYYEKKKKIKNNKSIEEQLLEALNNSDKTLIPYIRTETSKYGFVKIGKDSKGNLNKLKLPPLGYAHSRITPL